MQLRFDSIMAMTLWSHAFGPPCTIVKISATTVSNMSRSVVQHDALVSVFEMCTSQELQMLCCQQTRHK